MVEEAVLKTVGCNSLGGSIPPASAYEEVVRIQLPVVRMEAYQRIHSDNRQLMTDNSKNHTMKNIQQNTTHDSGRVMNTT